MPFLRRRGNMVSESDIRRHTFGLVPSKAPQLPSIERNSTERELPGSASDARDGTDTSCIADADARVDVNFASEAPGGDDRPQSSPRPESPPMQEESQKHRRFSALRFRNASDSQLSIRARQQAEKPPPLPTHPPEIITTAPTMEFEAVQKKPSRMRLAGRLRRSGDAAKTSTTSLAMKQTRDGHGQSISEDTGPPMAGADSRVSFQEPENGPSSHHPPAYGENDGTMLALPANRISESSRSDASSGDHGVYASTTTTTQTVRTTTTTTFFRLPRRKPKAPEPLFPLSHLPQKGKKAAGMSQHSASSSSLAVPALSSGTSVPPTPGSGPGTPRPSTSHSRSTIARSSVSREATVRQAASPATALFRPGSMHSGQSSPTRVPRHLRGRSSTMSSVGRDSTDEYLVPPTTRTSSSTGRKSFGDLFGLSRLRQNSEIGLSRQGTATPATPGSSASKNNSLQLVREQVVLPERRDDDTPVKYLGRLEEVVSRGVIASALSRGTDSFSAAVLRSYMRSFSFFGDPMDMAIRKLLMEAELPRETQQIDRCLQAFANRYHECNPGIYSTPDQAYFIAFSLLILHTDVFNKNNKHKMQKLDYLKNTGGEGIFDEILECLYDNITYTPFIHVEDDLDINGERIVAHKTKRKTMFPGGPVDHALKKSAKEPLDPYALIIDGKLDVLRPSLKEVMHLDDPYSYLGTAKVLDLKELQKTFFKTGILQIVSARSRPDAFMSEQTATNPEEAHPGIVDIKITKVGLLWRKDAKRKKTRSRWQEWGAILTGAQLYFFRNTTWVKNLMHQYESHIKQGNDGVPVIFKPPLDHFKPDVLISTDGAVALLDSTYRKHKYAFVYVRHGGLEEVLLADDEDEMNDWLAKLNYAAAFRTSGVRMRGVVGGHYEGQSRRGMRRLDSSDATQLIQTPTGEVSIARGHIDHKMAEDILAARRDIMAQKIADAADKLAAAEKELDLHLRNARHLQILAPIQAKTRDQLLLAAARMSAQLKWTRMEIWKLRCHRDILVQDLDEERQAMGSPSPSHPHPHPHPHLQLPPSPSPISGHSSTSGEETLRPTDQAPAPAPAPAPAEAGSEAKPRSPRSPPTLSVPSRPQRPESRDGDSAAANMLLQTPPATAVQARQRSASTGARRKPSISGSLLSSSPPPVVSLSQSRRTQHEIDSDERALLEQAGLLTQKSPDNGGAAIGPDSSGEAGERLPADKLERNKLRRSLQRTLREGAGHLSHHRSKKGKEPHAGAAPSTDEAGSDHKLTRGAGSFVVHGKKASVINFGSELQNMSQDDKMRHRQSMRRDEHQPVSPSSIVVDDDYQSAVGDASEWRERRESAASASTATARSFRELHRKYSRSTSAAGARLALPSDEDSEVAVSFSDGRRTPLPPIDNESSDEEEDEAGEEEEEEEEEEEDDDDDEGGGCGENGRRRSINDQDAADSEGDEPRQ